MADAGPLLLGVEEAADQLGIRRSVLYERLLTGELASVKIGRRRLIPRQALEEYVKRLIAEQVPA